MGTDTTAAATWLDDEAAAAIHDAFSLGIALVELRSRLSLAEDACESDESKPLIDESVWMASQWRATFNRIVTLHAKRIENSSTESTLYDPPTAEELPYLHVLKVDGKDIDLGNIGLQPTDLLPAAFRLQDVTRRALNVLATLYVSPEQSITRSKVESYQEALVAAVLEKEGGKRTAPRGDRMLAISYVGSRLNGLLEAWDGYLRERFYGAGARRTEERKLRAYEAGRSMAWFSWGMSVKTTPARMDAMMAESKSSDMGPMLRECWQHRFEKRNVAYLQQQLVGLGGALDDAWYAAHPDVKRPMDDDPMAPFNPELPSACLHAVEHGLDFWRRTVEWLDAKKNVWTSAFSDDLRVALVAQMDIWQALVTGRQDLTSFSAKTITETMTRELMTDFEDAAQRELLGAGKEQLESVAAKARTALLVFVLVVAVIVAAIIWASHDHLDLKSALPGLGAAGTVAGGWFTNRFIQGKKDETAGAGAGAAVKEGLEVALSPLKMLTGSGGEALSKAFQAGYDRVRILLSEIDHDVSVAYPLFDVMLKYTVKHGLLPREQKSAYTFLTSVIWSTEDRQAALEQVSRAAFGPLAAVARATIKRPSPPPAGADSKP
jgi:hypothetical protein